jgi:uncharacterized protein with gpF-like domain
MPIDYAAGRVPQFILDYFRQKGWKVGFSYLDVWLEEHACSFTVAKAMELDILQAIRAAVDQALAEGQTYEAFVQNLMPTLQQQGWWGYKLMVDPVTGEEVIAEVGTPRRLKIIYNTNMRVARSVGQWQRIQRTKDILPYLLYQHGPSREPRPEHLAWHGLLLPADDAWWSAHYPPSAWGCKCHVRQVTATEYSRLQQTGIPAASGTLPSGQLSGERIQVQTTAPPTEYYSWTNPRTGKTEQIPQGVDPGWNWNPGDSRLRQLQQLLAEKQNG